MKSQPKPIQIPDDIAARCTGPDQAKRMDALFRAVIAIPRLEGLNREAEWKKKRASKK